MRRFFSAAVVLSLIFSSATLFAATQSLSLDGVWQIRLDAENAGREAHWEASPLAETKPISVPGVIQQVWPEYHGVVWYERLFVTPPNPNAGGRTLLRFHQAEYLADVWLNGKYLGFHEGGEAAFELDASAALAKTGESNRLTVRVLNPLDTPIDGISMANIPRRNNTNTVTPGCGYASGGLVDSVELLLVPAVRIADVQLIPNWKTGEITARLTIQNAAQNAANQKTAGKISLSAASADGGEFTFAPSFSVQTASGEQIVEGRITIADFKLWNLNDPNLYAVTAEYADAVSTDKKTATCGFRDFRFENGAFRLNGKRIYLKCSHSGSDSPITHRLPFDPDLYRKDIIICKTMGFNTIRYIAGMPRRFQLDLCDRIGFMVYDECLAGWCFGPCPERKQRFIDQTEGMIRRDRNHPSVVIWGLLNETPDVELTLQAAHFLPRVRQLDPDRMVFLNSGSFDPFAGEVTKRADYAIHRRQNAPLMPAAIKNEKSESFFFDGTNWTADTFFLHPGDSGGEYAALKWTAPADGNYLVEAKFTDVVADGCATVDLHVFNGTDKVWTGYLNLNGAGKENAWSGRLPFQSHGELTLVVGIGDSQGYGDTTAVTLRITGDDGTVFDAKNDFASDKNPNGAWTYGFLPAGEIHLASFTPFDLGQKQLAFEPIGRFANPFENQWRNELGDTHPYKPVPHTASVINELRTHSKGNLPVFLSEYGVGSCVDLFRLTRYYEQYGATDAADALHYRDRYDRFMADWNRWKLDDTFASTEDFFRQAIFRMAEQRRIGINAIRANANVVAHSVTGTHDQGISGEGLTTIWRELKPGTVDAMADVFAPLRFCNFVEPVQVRSGEMVKFEVVAVNEDILAPGDYPVRYIVVGPKNERVFDETRTLTIPTPAEGKENPMVLPAASFEIPVTGPTGEYRFFAEFTERAAAAGGFERFFVTDSNDMSKTQGRFIVWGNDKNLLASLQAFGIDAVPFTRADGTQEPLDKKSKIVVGQTVDLDRDAEFPKLYDAVRTGADALFLSFDPLGVENDATHYLPFDQRGYRNQLPNWLYHKDDWAKRDAAFDGLPTGEVLDYVFYREMIPLYTFNSQTPEPDHSIAGAFSTQMGYDSGLSMADWKLGEGTVTISTWRILENLPAHPLAERMLRNLLHRMGE